MTTAPAGERAATAVRSLAGALARGWRRVDAAHDAVFVQRWRSGVARERRRREDELLAVLFLDQMGVDNPASYYASELYPHMLEQLHRWHRARGQDRFGDGVGCC